jgi:hypothetical protein
LLLISHHGGEDQPRGKLEAHDLLEKEPDLFLHFLFSLGFLGSKVFQVFLKLADLFPELLIFCLKFDVNPALISFVKEKLGLRSYGVC